MPRHVLRHPAQFNKLANLVVLVVQARRANISDLNQAVPGTPPFHRNAALNAAACPAPSGTVQQTCEFGGSRGPGPPSEQWLPACGHHRGIPTILPGSTGDPEFPAETKALCQFPVLRSALDR